MSEQIEKLLSREDLKRLGISYSNVHALHLEAEGKLPKRIYLSPGRVAWREREVHAYLQRCIAARARRSRTVVLPRDDAFELQDDADEVDTKLNLAKAYLELGDNEGARSILDEVVRDGSDAQRAEAQKLLEQAG